MTEVPNGEARPQIPIWNHPVIRWIAVLPGAILAAALTAVATGLITRLIGSSGGTWFGLEVQSEDPNSELSQGLGFHLWKFVFRPALTTYMFVYAARVLAPAYKIYVGYFFSGVTLFGTLWCFFLLGSTDQLNWRISVILSAFFVGGVIGLRYKP